MVNLKTIKVNRKINVRFQKVKDELEEYAIARKQFEKMLEETESEDEKVYTHEEIMNMGLEWMESKMSELSKEEQLETRKFINNWRKILGEV